jgi:hypothetical protein
MIRRTDMIKVAMSPMAVARAFRRTFLNTVRLPPGLHHQRALKVIRRRSTGLLSNPSTVATITMLTRIATVSWTIRAIPKRRTSIRTIAGSGMTRAAMMSTSIWTIHGRMGASPQALGRVTFSGLKVEDPAGSGLAASFSASPTTMPPIAVTGSGTATTSWSMTTRITLVGIWERETLEVSHVCQDSALLLLGVLSGPDWQPSGRKRSPHPDTMERNRCLGWSPVRCPSTLPDGAVR